MEKTGTAHLSVRDLTFMGMMTALMAVCALADRTSIAMSVIAQYLFVICNI